MKLIDNDKVLKMTENYGTTNGTTLGRHSGVVEIICYQIAKLPTIEAKPVRHGTWKYKVIDGFVPDYDCVCSECGTSGVPDYKYCPNCGAKMDGGETNV